MVSKMTSLTIIPDWLNINPTQWPWTVSIRSLLSTYTRLSLVFIELSDDFMSCATVYFETLIVSDLGSKWSLTQIPDRLNINPDQGSWMVFIRSLLPTYTRLSIVSVEIYDDFMSCTTIYSKTPILGSEEVLFRDRSWRVTGWLLSSTTGTYINIISVVFIHQHTHECSHQPHVNHYNTQY